jgi:hypothetical protein
VNTQRADCFSGVKVKIAMQIPTEATTAKDILAAARTFESGFHTVDWSEPQNNPMQVFGRERADYAHRTEQPNRDQHRLERCSAQMGQVPSIPGKVIETYGENAYCPFSYVEFILTQASSI